MEPSGDERNLEKPAPVKSRARPCSRLHDFGLNHLVSAQGEREESPSASSSIPFATSETQRQRICISNIHSVSVFTSLFLAAPQSHTGRAASPTPRGGSPQFDALQGRPDQSELRSHFRHEAGPIAAWLTQGRVTLRQPVPFRQRGKRNGCKGPRARSPKVVLVAGDARARARARQPLSRAPRKGRTAGS